MICAAFPNTNKNVTFKAFGCGDQSSLVTGSDIAARTIVASNIASGEITANEIHSNTITASEIASWAVTTDKLAANSVTAGKLNVDELSAITANMWDVHVWVTTDWDSYKSWIRLYPSWKNWTMDFYYNKNVVGTMKGYNMSWVWNCIHISWDYVVLEGSTYNYLAWTTYCSGKLRIPVWTNLYD